MGVKFILMRNPKWVQTHATSEGNHKSFCNKVTDDSPKVSLDTRDADNGFPTCPKCKKILEINIRSRKAFAESCRKLDEVRGRIIEQMKNPLQHLPKSTKK